MAKSYQKFTAVGNVGTDPEIRHTPRTKVARIPFATSRRWVDGSGTPKEKTEWHRLAVWNPPKGPQLADFCEQYVRKGDQLFIEGRVEYRSYVKDGREIWVTEIIVTELLLLGKPVDREPPTAEVPDDVRAFDDAD